MSQHIYISPNGYKVVLGYDRPLHYVFCTIERIGTEEEEPDFNTEIVYSNLDDPCAGTFLQQVDYFREVLRGFDITVPEEMFAQVKIDQEHHIGNRTVRYTDNKVLEA